MVSDSLLIVSRWIKWCDECCSFDIVLWVLVSDWLIVLIVVLLLVVNIFVMFMLWVIIELVDNVLVVLLGSLFIGIVLLVSSDLFMLSWFLSRCVLVVMWLFLCSISKLLIIIFMFGMCSFVLLWIISVCGVDSLCNVFSVCCVLCFCVSVMLMMNSIEVSRNSVLV